MAWILDEGKRVFLPKEESVLEFMAREKRENELKEQYNHIVKTIKKSKAIAAIKTLKKKKLLLKLKQKSQMQYQKEANAASRAVAYATRPMPNAPPGYFSHETIFDKDKKW